MEKKKNNETIFLKWLININFIKRLQKLSTLYNDDVFFKKINDYLSELSQSFIKEEEKLFINIESCEIENLSIGLNIFISFQLNKKKSDYVNLKTLAQKESSDSSSYEQIISNDTKLETQIFYFNFNSRKTLETNILQFAEFINSAFISIEQREIENEYYLNIFKNYDSSKKKG